MADTALRPTSIGSLAFKPSVTEAGVAVWFEGTADPESPTFLDTIFAQIHAEAQRLQLPEVVIDLSRVHFLNSSCIKSLATWIGMVRELPADKRYIIHFRLDEQVRWQRLCMHPLRALGVGAVRIAVK